MATVDRLAQMIAGRALVADRVGRGGEGPQQKFKPGDRVVSTVSGKAFTIVESYQNLTYGHWEYVAKNPFDRIEFTTTTESYWRAE